MKGIRIIRKNNNIELMARIANSFARKYDCGVKYNPETDAISYYGDEYYRPFILEETASLFNQE